jgi:branched-chain amino acid transport system permease protein
MILYLAQVATFAAIFAILASSYSLLLGSTGIFSAAHASFFGFGAYAAAYSTIRWDLPFPVDILIGAAAAAVVSAVLSLPMSRLLAEQVLVASLALQLVFTSVFENAISFTGGTSGQYGIPRPVIGAIEFVDSFQFAQLAIAVALILVVLVGAMLRRRASLILRATRDDTLLAMSLGIAATVPRLVAWIVSGALAGAAGAMFARFIGYISPASFGINQTLLILTMVVVGGLGSTWGAVGGAIVLVSIPELLTYLPDALAESEQAEPIIYAVILLLVVVFRPQGLVPERNLKLRRAGLDPVARTDGREQGPVSPPSEAPSSAAPVGASLRLSGIRKSFGGLKVLTGIDLELRPHEVTAILGPNGAGKTTLFNVMTGVIKPDEGSVTWGTQDITGASPDSLARLGMARSFQDGRLFTTMTVYEHLLLAAETRQSTLRSMFAPRHNRATDQQILETLTELGLEDVVDARVDDLAYGQQKTLLIAEMMLWSPSILLLDEVAAGLDHRAVDDIAAKVREMRTDQRIICLVEHNLDFVWKTADRVVLMGSGGIVADGTPKEIRSNPLALETYFGKAMLK